MSGSDETAGSHSHNVTSSTHTNAATALFLGIGGALIDVEVSEILLLTA